MLWAQMSLAGSFSWGSPLGGLSLLGPEVVGSLCQLPPESGSVQNEKQGVCGPWARLCSPVFSLGSPESGHVGQQRGGGSGISPHCQGSPALQPARPSSAPPLRARAS